MLRSVLVVSVLLLSTTCALGDWLVSTSEDINLWLNHGSGPLLQFTIGYITAGGVLADPSTAIGDDLWFAGPGTYDLTADLQFPAFLGYATNGQTDDIGIRLSDSNGAELTVPFWSWEDYWLGRYPDLAPLSVTGASLSVTQVAPSVDGIGVTVRMEYVGTPEPTSAVLFVGMALLNMRRQRGCGVGRCAIGVASA